MQVDWAGNTLAIHDPVTGAVSKAYLFLRFCFATAMPMPKTVSAGSWKTGFFVIPNPIDTSAV